MTAEDLILGLEPLLQEGGFELVDVELAGSGKSPTVRVYVDSPSGASFDRIVEAQSLIERYLEEEDPFPGAYTLEVSSPGIDRHLRTKEHFRRFSGSKAQLVTAGIPGRSKWTGRLAGMEGDDVVLDIDGAAQRIPFGNIRKAHVIGVVDFNGRKEEHGI